MSTYSRIGLAGYPGTGKTACADYLVAERDYTVFEGSTCLKETAARDYGLLLRTRPEHNEFHQRMQREFGLDWMAQQFLKVKADRAVQVGIRAVPVAQSLRSNGGLLIALDCPEHTAFQRMPKDDPKSPQTIEEYREHCALDNTAGSLNVDQVLAMADARVDTSQPRGLMYGQLASIAIRHESGLPIVP